MEFRKPHKCPICGNLLVNSMCVNPSCVIGSHTLYEITKDDGKRYSISPLTGESVIEEKNDASDKVMEKLNG